MNNLLSISPLTAYVLTMVHATFVDISRDLIYNTAGDFASFNSVGGFGRFHFGGIGLEFDGDHGFGDAGELSTAANEDCYMFNTGGDGDLDEDQEVHSNFNIIHQASLIDKVVSKVGNVVSKSKGKIFAKSGGETVVGLAK